MSTNKVVQKVVDQDIALDSYLTTLLDEIPEDIEQQHKKKITVGSKTRQLAEEKKTADKTGNQANSIQVSSEKKVSIKKIVKPLSIMPEWSQHEFQALFFKVDKLILAAPLTDLLRTIKIEKTATKIPGQPSWFMGLLDNHEQRIGILDTGQLILGKTKGQQRDLEKQPFQSILITHDGKWGLACDEILSIGKLQPEKVRWRTLRNKRPWLVGTVIDELTAIIDVDQLVPHRKSRY